MSGKKTMKERILILGADGFIGWNLMMSLGMKNEGLVYGVDNSSRRIQVKEIESDSLTPIKSPIERVETYEEVFKKNNIKYISQDITIYANVKSLLKEIKPTVIINLAQMPSAPYSMMDAVHSVWTTGNNTIGNLNVLWAMKEECPDAHLIKMGTMGEYGTPNIDITEGFLPVEYKGRKDLLPYPKQGGSFYHWAKVTESNHCMFAAKIWNLKITDLMQGIIYGVTTNESKKDERLLSRFDYDGVFGTALNRFVVQSIAGVPITPYGKGKQTRGFIHIRDAMKCFELYIKNPADKGEYRVFNQLAEQSRTITELAEIVSKTANKKGYETTIKKYPNPRKELEEHYYNVEASKVKDLGLEPINFEEAVEEIFDDLEPYKDRIKKDVINPKIKWS